MFPLNLPEPPTAATLADARRSLESSRSNLATLKRKIEAAEAALAQIVADSQCAINEMLQERSVLEGKLFHTMAYLSPIRRLPDELLREIFLCNFAGHPCCAWVLSAVSKMWRRLALSMPMLWSKIRLLTTQHSSADTIRLWLERSGNSIPLDVEIFLRVSKSSSEPISRPRRSSSPTSWLPPLHHNHGGPPIQYIVPQPLHPPGLIPILPPSNTPIIIPPSPGGSESWSPQYPASEKSSVSAKTSMHWGHIAIFYLVEQMHRWERFVFRFDKQFSSIGALKSITGDAPLLREFEVSSAEPAFYADWPWLPSANPNTEVVLPCLQILTLQYAQFKWSSPMFSSNLRVLNLRALPTSHLPLDRVLYIVSSNPNLEVLSLFFNVVMPAVLPLCPTSLTQLKEFSIGGHHLLSQLIDSLILPSLETFNLDIEAREPIEDTISNLVVRSNSPPLTRLAVAYATSTASAFYYGPGGIMISWTLLADLSQLETLNVGGTPLEPLLAALGPPDDDSNQISWACPNLVSLGLKNCHAHSEGVSKLVHMVEARNPDPGSGTGMTFNGVSPVKLKHLEMYDCASLGQDVLKWLMGRIDEVVCTEPVYERSPLPNPYL